MAVVQTNQIEADRWRLEAGLHARLSAQRAAFEKRPPDYGRRMEALNALRTGLLERKQEFVNAISEDFGGRATEETLALEFVPLLDEIRHARRHLKQWMKPRRVSSGWQFRPGRARILYQPLGVVGIISAWNYPLLLCISPLINALAAGNHAMIKPSELAPRTAERIEKMIAQLFPADYVTVVTGGADVAAAFASLPFDHLLFTGSSRIGKKVMRAASENLTPVTLELGGKSPAIIHRDYPLQRAATRILTGKLYNAGQTCLAPDYVLVPTELRGAFLELAQKIVPKLYPRLVRNPQYTRIINGAHYRRLADYVDDARRKGAEVIEINPAAEACNEENRVFPPTLLHPVRDDMKVMQEEVFGPILPVQVYDSLDEAIEYVSRQQRPLALYYFDDNSGRIEQVLRRTVSGGVTVNDVLFHFAQNELPYGGVGTSGMGEYHGFYGFERFSKRKGVFIQSRVAATSLLRPPYGRLAHAVIRFLSRG